MLSLIKYESYRVEKSYIDLKALPTQYFLIKFRLITKMLISIIVGKGLKEVNKSLLILHLNQQQKKRKTDYKVEWENDWLYFDNEQDRMFQFRTRCPACVCKHTLNNTFGE